MMLSKEKKFFFKQIHFVTNFLKYIGWAVYTKNKYIKDHFISLLYIEAANLVHCWQNAATAAFAAILAAVSSYNSNFF